MFKFLLIVTMLFAMPAYADYTLVIPQRPGGGTSAWAQIVATELEKKLGEKIILRHIRGARDIPGFNKFHNDLQNDDKTIMVSHGGNGVSFLQENVDYNYADYDSIGLMNLNIIAGIKSNTNTLDRIKFAAGSGNVPEAFAMTLLRCGNNLNLDEYVICFKENVTWVHGMNSGARRLAYRRGELNATRENPAAFKKHVQPGIEGGTSRIWFHHGILDAATKTHNDDPNYPGYQMEILFEKIWGEKPAGEFYNAYKLVKSFRDGLQKALWVRKGNPNTEKLREALTSMRNDPESVAKIQSKVGTYEWLIGEEGNKQRNTLMSFITQKALKTLVKFNTKALGLKSVYKKTLIDK